ncbi:phosphodiester glycosidase family protein [Candidatus Woesebacteria bacterium]|nr:phosphodiester glycosidase family protein [Candidatus Woesebacteria bacterium]
MKKTFIILLCVFLISSLAITFSFLFNKKVEKINVEVSDNISEKEDDYISIEFDDFEYFVHYYITEKPEDIFLYTNLYEKQQSVILKEKENCSLLISGGFYDKDYKHLGLLYKNDEIVSKSIRSDTFNAYFTIDNNYKVKISREEPETPLYLALQSGPMLIEQRKLIKLDLKNDKHARRAIIGLTNVQEVIFMAVTDFQTGLSGPYLEDLPQILKLFEDSIGIGLTDAINLDGGGAMAFITEKVKITENQVIGSFFCIK